MMSSMPERALCEHRVLEGTPVHEFVLKEGSAAAINELFDITEEILSALPAPESYPALVDASSGMYAVSVALSRIRQLATKFPNRRRSKIAMLMPDTSLLRVIDAFMRPFGIVRFFRPDEHSEALLWLAEA
jgi:hypothetical protein